MPTSFTAVLVFLVIVVPGLAFELSLRRRSPSRVESPFVESARVVLVGALSTAAATALLIALREIRPGSLPSPTGLLADSARYVTAHPELTAIGLAAELFAATALALLAVGLVRSPTGGGIQSFDDVWYELLYNDVPAGKRPKLVVALKSGGYRVSGFFHSMNTHPEVDRRELVLKSVELFREDQASGDGTWPAVYVRLAIPAREIAWLAVSHAALPPVPAPAGGGAPAPGRPARPGDRLRRFQWQAAAAVLVVEAAVLLLAG
ncbi:MULTISPECIES: DUF6338 family protein [Streptomyces]|uniref:DUF6338 family protein n=1 Tax=Streptomyces edwardsiae TaxID=3075527 RepID=A0ABU2Q196_9ACTN|nr:DUF6338 family protein [Streptomyces sp. DSM 41636]MDT0397280.1 DUF6338 family protein [Streptomyces sp. DSM 41636]